MTKKEKAEIRNKIYNYLGEQYNLTKISSDKEFKNLLKELGGKEGQIEQAKPKNGKYGGHYPQKGVWHADNN